MTWNFWTHNFQVYILCSTEGQKVCLLWGVWNTNQPNQQWLKIYLLGPQHRSVSILNHWHLSLVSEGTAHSDSMLLNSAMLDTSLASGLFPPFVLHCSLGGRLSVHPLQHKGPTIKHVALLQIRIFYCFNVDWALIQFDLPRCMGHGYRRLRAFYHICPEPSSSKLHNDS